MKVKETRYKLHIVHTGTLVSINCCVSKCTATRFGDYLSVPTLRVLFVGLEMTQRKIHKCFPILVVKAFRQFVP